MYRGFSGFAARSWGSAARSWGSAAHSWGSSAHLLWRLGTGEDFSELFPKELRRLRWFQSPGMSVWAQRQIILELFPMGLRRLGTEAIFSELFPIDSDVYMRYWAQEGICHELFPMLSCAQCRTSHGEQFKQNQRLCPKSPEYSKKQGEQICEMPLLCPNPGIRGEAEFQQSGIPEACPAKRHPGSLPSKAASRKPALQSGTTEARPAQADTSIDTEQAQFH